MTIIITTDFSASSRNALAYVCEMVKGHGVQIVLLYIYPLPSMYLGDGLAVTTINDTMTDLSASLNEEVQWVQSTYPSQQVDSRVIVGGYFETLKEQVRQLNPSLVAIGLSGDYDDLWSSSDDFLEAFHDLTVPVVSIPAQVTYRPIANICFACNFKVIDQETTMETIKRILLFTGARLHIVYVYSNARESGNNGDLPGKLYLQNALKEFSPAFYSLNEPNIVDTVGHFVQTEKIDLLMVIPRRHGVWTSLFHKSNSKALARLNCVPVLALRE